MDVLQQIKKVPEFKNLEEDHLQWLVQRGTIATYHDGDKVFKIGDPIDEFRIILQGEVNLYREQAGNLRHLGTIEQYEITGLLPYSRMKGAGADGIVSGETIALQLHKQYFQEMIREHHALTEVLVHSMTDRVREFTQQQQQNDKMMALGKLSAGLAHELNNPSAAVVRSANELKKHLSNLPEKFKSVIKIRTTDNVVDEVNNLVFSKIAETGKAELSLMEKSEKEEMAIEWLDDNGIENGYEIAETFIDYNFTINDFEKLKEILRPEDKAAVIGWLGQVLTTEKLVNEIEEASKRINTLVCSVKSYTHMDRAPEKERADIREGIRNTLTMLTHKIKKNQIKLIENIADDLPHANVFISSLNQVWTNLIDNAIDALEGRPDATLEIKAVKDLEFLLVEVIDNGPGIPTDVQDKVFDSFFTTKPIGKGTGLGLEVVRQIINQHNGKVYLKSEPGRTVFSVCIPIS